MKQRRRMEILTLRDQLARLPVLTRLTSTSPTEHNAAEGWGKHRAGRHFQVCGRRPIAFESVLGTISDPPRWS